VAAQILTQAYPRHMGPTNDWTIADPEGAALIISQNKPLR
jgi:hypothetical protein